MRRLMPPAARFGVWLALAALCGAGLSVSTAALTVTNANDNANSGSLRQMISVAGPGATIVFDPSLNGQTILLTNELVIGRDLTILGPGAAHLAISGNGAHRVFNVLAGTVTLSGLTITNGMNVGTNGADAWILPITFTPIPAGPGGGGAGGGILSGGSLTVSNCVFSGNAAVGGRGGAGIGDHNVAFNLDLPPANGGPASGGAIYNSGTLILLGCTLSTNSASGGTGGNGGDHFGHVGTLNTDGATGGSGAGGAIYNASTAACTNCTMTGNAANGGNGGPGGVASSGNWGGNGGNGGNGSGGAIYNQSQVTPSSLISCTLSGNSASGGAGGDGNTGSNHSGANGINGQAFGGGAYAPEGGQSFMNTIVAGNDADTDGPDVDGRVTDQGFNLIGQADGSDGWLRSVLLGWVFAPLDPLLGPLQNNGGPTPTMLPLLSSAAFSAAIDNGINAGLATDQRGFARTVNLPDSDYPNAAGGDGTDIGAVEVQPPAVDIGLRAFDGVTTNKIACEVGTPTSPLRIAKSGNIYGIILVETNAPDASKFQVKTSSGIKAWRKLP